MLGDSTIPFHKSFLPVLVWVINQVFQLRKPTSFLWLRASFARHFRTREVKQSGI
jgi:hypothetical protein